MSSIHSTSDNFEIKTSDDTNNSLNELFKMNNSKFRQKPLIERKLPESFFNPPSRINNNHVQHISGTPVHYKAFSSPATLEETTRAGSTYRANHPHHSKQLSLDSQNDTQILSNELTNMNSFNSKSSNSQFKSKISLDVEVSKLPDGFEMALQDNKVYFLNHNTQETTWFDPRIPEEDQEWGMTLEKLSELHLKYLNNNNNNNLRSVASSHIPSKMINQLHHHQHQYPGVHHHHHHNHQHHQSGIDHSCIGPQQSLENFANNKHNHFRSCSQPVSSSGATLDPHSSLTMTNYPINGNTHRNQQHQQQQQQQQQQQMFIIHNSSNTQHGNNTTPYPNYNHLHPNYSSPPPLNNNNNSPSNNSSCSNLSSCLNGLNLSSPSSMLLSTDNALVSGGGGGLGNTSPYQQASPQFINQQQTSPGNGGNYSNNTNPQHHHQDSLDSGVGQSVISQLGCSNGSGGTNSNNGSQQQQGSNSGVTNNNGGSSGGGNGGGGGGLLNNGCGGSGVIGGIMGQLIAAQQAQLLNQSRDQKFIEVSLKVDESYNLDDSTDELMECDLRSLNQ